MGREMKRKTINSFKIDAEWRRFCCVYDEASQEKLVYKQALQFQMRWRCSFTHLFFSLPSNSRKEFSRQLFSSWPRWLWNLYCLLIKIRSPVGKLISMLMMTVQRVSLCVHKRNILMKSIVSSGAQTRSTAQMSNAFWSFNICLRFHWILKRLGIRYHMTRQKCRMKKYVSAIFTCVTNSSFTEIGKKEVHE